MKSPTMIIIKFTGKISESLYMTAEHAANTNITETYAYLMLGTIHAMN